MMKAVVSGASGFLGSKLVPELANRGFDHVCGLVFEKDVLARFQQEYSDNQNLSFVASNDWGGARAALCEADVLIHCAFPRAQAAEHLAAGLKYGNDLFIAARDSGCKAIINISSQSVYDSFRDYPATEESPLVLDTTYAAAKYASELMLDDVFDRLPHTSVRLASLIGPGFDQRVPNKMIKKAMAGETIEVQGGNQVFGYLDVIDAVDALCALAASNAGLWKSAFNVGPMQSATLQEIAELVFRCLSKYGIDVAQPKLIGNPLERPSNSSLESTLFTNSIGWHSSSDLSRSINSLVIYQMNRLYEAEK